MATYQVIKPGFINDVFHHPDDPDHNTVTVDTKFEDCPSWLKFFEEDDDAPDDAPDAAPDAAPDEELTPQQKAAITRKKNAEAKKLELDAVNFQEDPTLAGPTEL